MDASYDFHRLKALGILVVALLMGTLYAGLVALIGRATMGYLIAWPIGTLIFWIVFRKFRLLRYAGFIAVIPVTFLVFEIHRSVRSPGMNADIHRSLDRSHYTPSLRIAKSSLDTRSGPPRQIYIGKDGFRADPDTGRGNPKRCRFVLIGDSMIYGSGLAYQYTFGPLLAGRGVPACVFGVTGNSPVDYLATLRFVADRIESDAHVAFYIYAYNDFASLSLLVKRGVLTLSNSLRKLFEWIFYFDRWRQATWTYALFRREQTPPAPKHWQYQTVEGNSIRVVSTRDPAQYDKPAPLNKRRTAAFRFFLKRLDEFVKDRSWRVHVLFHPDDSEVYANLSRQSAVFVDLDPRRADGLKLCKEFSFYCEDISRYIYERSYAAGLNPFFAHDRHFSTFGTRIVAEHFVSLTKRTADDGNAIRN